MAARSASIDALYRNIKSVWPGVVIGWIGDPAHASRVSGHNPDDTAGVRAELTDADTLQEVRSLDVMFGPAFGPADAQALLRALTGPAESRARLYYVIHTGSQNGRGSNWSWVRYDGDPHTTHVHISGWAGDDENGADWPHVLALRGAMAIDKRAVHAFLKEVLGATDPEGSVERQIRDMIRGGVQSPFPDRRSLLSNVASAEEVNGLKVTVTALVEASAGIANRVEALKVAIDALTSAVANGQGGGPTAERIAEVFGARLSAE